MKISCYNFILILFSFTIYNLQAQQISVDWDMTYGGSDVDQANELQQTSDGGYIIAGTFSNSVSNSFNAFLMKTDSQEKENFQFSASQPFVVQGGQYTLHDRIFHPSGYCS